MDIKSCLPSEAGSTMVEIAKNMPIACTSMSRWKPIACMNRTEGTMNEPVIPVSMPLMAPNGTDSGRSHFRGTLMLTFSNRDRAKTIGKPKPLTKPARVKATAAMARMSARGILSESPAARKHRWRDLP